MTMGRTAVPIAYSNIKLSKKTKPSKEESNGKKQKLYKKINRKQ